MPFKKKWQTYGLFRLWNFFGCFFFLANTEWQVYIMNSSHRLKAINMKLCTDLSDIQWKLIEWTPLNSSYYLRCKSVYLHFSSWHSKNRWIIRLCWIWHFSSFWTVWHRTLMFAVLLVCDRLVPLILLRWVAFTIGRLMPFYNQYQSIMWLVCYSRITAAGAFKYIW